MASRAGTMAAVAPAMRHQPMTRRIAPVLPHRLQGDAADVSDFAPEASDLGFVQRARRPLRWHAQAPADLIRHPVADAGKAALVEQQGLQGRSGKAFQEMAHRLLGEAALQRLRREISPPLGRIASLHEVEADLSKLSGIGEDEGHPLQGQDQVIVGPGLVPGHRGAQGTGHAQVQGQPGPWGKLHEQLLAMGPAAPQLTPCQGGDDVPGPRFPKETHLWMRLHPEHSASDSRIPLLAIVFDLGEFRHDGLVCQGDQSAPQPKMPAGNDGGKAGFRMEFDRNRLDFPEVPL